MRFDAVHHDLTGDGSHLALQVGYAEDYVTDKEGAAYRHNRPSAACANVSTKHISRGTQPATR